MPAGLDCRVWNGVEIQRRPSDGYVNATAMCKANGKRWHEYHSNQRSQDYIAALTGALRSAGNPADPIQAVTTGPNHLRGTWVHPRIAVDLARWISPAFAVWMDGWFLEVLQAQQQQPPARVVDAMPVAAATPPAMPVPPRPTVVFSAPPAWSHILETYVSEVEAEMDALPPPQRPRSRKYARPLATHFMQWLINRHAQLVIGADGGSIPAMPMPPQVIQQPLPIDPPVAPMPNQPRLLSGHRTEPTPPFQAGDVLAGPELARMLGIRPRTLNTWARNNPIGSIRDGWRLIGQGKVHCGALGSTVPPGSPSWLFEKV